MGRPDADGGLSRRQIMARLALLPVAATLVGPPSAVLAQSAADAGDERKTCPNPGLGASDVSFRESVEYVDLSPFGREKDCENCESWVPAKEGPCGGCTIMRGTVHVRGYCTSWAKV